MSTIHVTDKYLRTVTQEESVPNPDLKFMSIRYSFFRKLAAKDEVYALKALESIHRKRLGLVVLGKGDAKTTLKDTAKCMSILEKNNMEDLFYSLQYTDEANAAKHTIRIME